jgi:hypothetical protein
MIVDEGPTTLYKFLRQCGDEAGERRDCAVIACSVVTERPYSEVHYELKKLGRRAKCGTPMNITWQYLHTVGLIGHDITSFYEGSSVRSIGPQLPDKGNFFVFSHRHVSAVKDGIIEDWAVDRKKYTEAIFQIAPIGTPKPEKKTARKRSIVIDYERPTKAVHAICDIFYEDEPIPRNAQGNDRQRWGAFRAKVVAECVANGIHKSTAAVQCTKWMKDMGYYYSVMV